MRTSARLLVFAALTSWLPGGMPPPARAAERTALEIADIHFEYNSSANDLGVHVMLDGEDWRELKIVNPNEKTIFHVEGKGPYKNLGLTELFFEGAEPSLAEVELGDLLGRFPEGPYEFKGTTVDGGKIGGTSTLSHAIPAGPSVSTEVGPGDRIVIKWTEVTAPPAGFPNEPITIVGYQVLVDPFQVTLPASARMVTLPPEFVASLAPGTYPFEVLAIDASRNQTITEGSFVKP